MSTRTRSLGLLVARFAAVGLALAAGGYLVVTAQRRANPEPAPNHASDVVVPRIEAPTSSPDYLSSSKSMVIEPPTIVTQQDPVYLLGSKSGMVTTIAGDDDVMTTTEVTAPPADSPVFLPSSKFGGFSPRSSPQPLTFPPIEPAPATTRTTQPSPANTPPVFLPTSKSLTLRDAVRSAPRPVLTPGSTVVPSAPQPQVPTPQASKPKDR